MAPSKWRSGKTEATLEKVADRASQGETVEERSSQILDSIQIDSHTTTRVSPAEFLFGRKIRTKLPEFHEDHVVSEVQDRDGTMKVKAKLYADRERHAKYSDLVPGNSAAKTREAKQAVNTICTRTIWCCWQEWQQLYYQVYWGCSVKKEYCACEKVCSSRESYSNKTVCHVSWDGWWKGKECCLKETSPDRPWEGLWKIQNCYRRRSSTRPVRHKKLPEKFKDFGLRREFEQLCLLLLRCQESKVMSALDKCFWGCGYAWHWVSHYDDNATISKKNENLNSLRGSSLIEVTGEMRCRSKVQGKKVRALRVPRPPQLRRSLAHLLATWNGEAALSS